MVLTRSERNRLLSQGIDTGAWSEMANASCTSTETAVTTTPPVSTAVSLQGMISTTATITPAVQQFLTMASGNNSVNEFRPSDSSISSPEYSSITARNVRKEFRNNRPSQHETQNDKMQPSGDVVELLREEFSRQMREFQMAMRQEISRVVGQQRDQTSIPNGSNYNATANNQPPLATISQTGTMTYDGGTNVLQGNTAQLPPDNMQPPRTNAASYSGPQEQHNNYTQAFSSIPPPTSHHVQTNYHQAPQSRVDLSKWGIKFDGTTKTMSAEDFIFRLGILRQDYGCSFNDIIRSFHLLLEGQALDWYWNVRKLTPIRNWQDLETSFLMHYRRYENEFQIQKKIMDRRQAPGESFEDFYDAIIKLRNQQRIPYSERDLIEIMKSNLRPALAHLLFSVRIEGLNDFCQQAKRAESLLFNQRQQQLQRPYATQRVSELSYEEDTIPETSLEVEALTANNRYTCWNCKQVGHSFVDCPSPTRRFSVLDAGEMAS